jgi:two-component system, chemotaxis family, CheB/CheR fusion protein
LKKAKRTNTDVLDAGFPIVGVGASAGGLEAFTQLLEHIPPDTGMAFVLIQHLDPTHASFLADALNRATKMAVTQANDGEQIEPNHVYVIPPSSDIALLHGALTLLPRKTADRKQHLPVDFFFRSLAKERGNRAIGVILSGTASDGTEGLRAIKGEDGITFVQDPKSAKFDGMPRSAVEAGVVDYALSIPALAQELVRLSRHPYVAALPARLPKNDPTLLNKLFVVVRDAVGVDFSEYKAPTFERRLARRMALRKVSTLPEYLDLLREDPHEIRSLYEDTLIHVTSFFRDPEVFETLRTDVFPAILKTKASGEPIRVWAAGCATGEEVYSLAITLLETLAETEAPHPVQIFGSDISERAIEKARQGVFSEAAMKDVTDERRRRYFTKTDQGYRVTKMVRDLCVFVRHDLARDPPFSKLDLVSCRNVLIYFDQALQKRVLPTFHYALHRSGGYLLLGRTESISGFAQLFEPIDKAKKVFARTSGTSVLRFAPRSEVHPLSPSAPQAGNQLARRPMDLGKHLDRMMLARYAPPGVLVNEKMEILQFRGETGAFLRPAPGDPQNNLIKMARPGLVVVLRAAIAKAKQTMDTVRTEDVQVEHAGAHEACDVVVTPFPQLADAKDQLFVVVFEEHKVTQPVSAPKTELPEKTIERGRLQKLENQLVATEEYLQSVIDEQERSNDDLNSANEELVSGNEELQSMNEELETAKEELQSTNEELVTVNDELHNRNQETAQANSDLINLLSTVDVPILILDAKRNIRRFNPKARRILNILPADVGRPIDDFRSNLPAINLDGLIAEVIETNRVYEGEVRDRDGRWYRLAIRPYKTIDNKIDGATMSLVDIDMLKHHVSEAVTAKREAEDANRVKDEFLATLSHEIRTPLSSMLIQAELLCRGTMNPERAKRAGEIIVRGTRMQAKLIDDLLDVSRIVTGKLKFDFGPVDLRAVVKAALEGVAAPAQKKHMTFQVTLDAPSVVSGDAHRLQQVVANLLTNAVKFSPEHGNVIVKLEHQGDIARLMVSDAGSGIEPSFLPHVFERFAQEDGSTIRTHGGLGLGLAIASHLVQAHGGTIWAESEGKGKGASFFFTLRLVEIQAIKDGPAASPRAKLLLRHDLLNDLRVLIVDDDVGTRDGVAEILRELGAIVSVAGSAPEAMAILETFHPQLLLCDIAMAGEDGYSLIRKIRSLGSDHGGDVPALALTAFAGDENRQRALAAGFQAHLPKPIDLEQLTQVVADLSHRSVQASV